MCLCVNNNFSLFSEIQNIGNVKVVLILEHSFQCQFHLHFSLNFIICQESKIIHLHEPFPLSTISSLFFSSKRIFATAVI